MYKKNLIPVLIDDSPFHDSVMLRIVDLDRIDYYLNSQNGIIKLTHSINTYLAEEKAAETKRVEDEKRRQEELERQRDANVYYLTGNEYYSGLNGKIIDYSEAVYWFRKGVELGHLEAMYSLGYCYFHGSGVPHDYSKAKNLFEQAAQLGHMKAQFNLGKCYKKGYGTPINYSEAFAWFLKAAEQGYVLAQNNVAVCYEQGIGVPVNEEEAVKWYQLANEQGDAFAHDALVRLGKLHE
jgi:TPR repeat protein